MHADNIVPGIADVPPFTFTDYGNDNIEIRVSVDISLKAVTTTTYTKSKVDGLLVSKATTTYVDNSVASLLIPQQNTLNCVDPTNLATPVASYPLVLGSNNSKIKRLQLHQL